MAAPVATAPTPTPTIAPIVLPTRPRVLVFGDSYTAGFGAEDPDTQGFARVLPTLEPGWDVVVEGVASTGYLNPGLTNQGTYQQRIERLTYGDEFQLIILQGGSNDQSIENSTLPTAVDTTVQLLQSRFPSARLVMLGPVSVGSAANDAKRHVDEVLSDYADSRLIPYISPIRGVWIPSSRQAEWVNLDVGHLNAAGYVHMAQELAEALREHVTTTA